MSLQVFEALILLKETNEVYEDIVIDRTADPLGKLIRMLHNSDPNIEQSQGVETENEVISFFMKSLLLHLSDW